MTLLGAIGRKLLIELRLIELEPEGPFETAMIWRELWAVAIVALYSYGVNSYVIVLCLLKEGLQLARVPRLVCEVFLVLDAFVTLCTGRLIMIELIWFM